MQFLRQADTLAALRAAYLFNVTLHVLAASATRRVLALKLITVTVMLVIAGVHDFALGPAASRAEVGSSAAITARRRAAWLARVNALVGVFLVVAAVRLARG